MEEFKIVNLKVSNDENKRPQKKGESHEKPIIEGYNPPKKRYVFLALIAILIVIIVVFLNIVSSFTDYEEENIWTRSDTDESQYLEFSDNMLKFNSDGVFYTSFDGTLIWNYTYNLTKPVADICGDYMVIYDKKGNETDLFSNSGYINSVETTSPIIKAEVSANGVVALMLQENNITYLQLYDSKGTILASGEIHQENGDYPISMSISSSGTKLAVSSINVDSGNVNSKITFYDFSTSGKEKTDNIIAEYTYEDIIIPEIRFFEGDAAVAFGENEIIIFNDNSEETVAKEIYVSDEIKNVFYNDKYFGYVSESADENGTLQNKFTIYNLYGFMCIDKSFDETYEDIELMSNNEVLIKDSGSITIYSLHGIKKFDYDFGENIYKVIPTQKYRRYYLIKENATEEIQIK